MRAHQPTVTEKSVDVARGRMVEAGGNQLTSGERTALVELEGTIAAGLQSFVAVGRALTEIRDAKLYRQSHATFRDYCRERWTLEPRMAYRYIQAAEVAENVSNLDTEPPTNEAQARELARAPAEEQAALWSGVVEDAGGAEHVTASRVADAVDRRRQPEEEDADEQDAATDEHEEEPEPIKPPEPNGRPEFMAFAAKFRKKHPTLPAVVICDWVQEAWQC